MAYDDESASFLHIHPRMIFTLIHLAVVLLRVTTSITLLHRFPIVSTYSRYFNALLICSLPSILCWEFGLIFLKDSILMSDCYSDLASSVLFSTFYSNTLIVKRIVLLLILRILTRRCICFRLILIRFCLLLAFCQLMLFVLFSLIFSCVDDVNSIFYCNNLASYVLCILYSLSSILLFRI